MASKKRISEYNDKQGENIGKEIRRLEVLAKSESETAQTLTDTARKQKQLSNELASKEQSLMELEIKLKQDRACLDILQESVTKQQERNSVAALETDSKLRKAQDLNNENKGLLEDIKEGQKNNRNKQIDLNKQEKSLQEYKESLDALKVELDKYQENINIQSDKIQKAWDEYYKMKAIVDKNMKDTEDLRRGVEAEKAELAFEIAKIKAKK